jgi:hypothetical protein
MSSQIQKDIKVATVDELEHELKLRRLIERDNKEVKQREALAQIEECLREAREHIQKAEQFAREAKVDFSFQVGDISSTFYSGGDWNEEGWKWNSSSSNY